MKALVLALLLVPRLIHAEEPASPRGIVEHFLSSVQAGDVSVAYDKLFVGSSIPKSKPQAVSLMKSQTQTALSMYGKTLGFEAVKDERFGTSVVRLVYLLKFEDGPTVWEFYLYRPKSEWVIANVNFNDQFALLR